MRIRVFAVVLALAGLMLGQATVDQQVMQQSERRAGGPSSAKKVSPEQQKQGRQLLEAAEAQAMGLEGGMRAYGLLQLARAYTASDRGRAARLLEDALTATRGMDDDPLQTKRRLEEQILQALVPLAPQRADDLLGQVEPAARGTVLRALLSYYQKNKDMDRAIQVLYRVGQEKEIPYDAAAQVMSALPPEDTADVLQIFTTAFSSYRDNAKEHTGAAMGSGDFANLILRFWSKVPKQTALDAISEVLKQAKASDSGGSSVSMASEQGAVAFNSYYEFRLFQLLPVMRQLDETAAKKLLEEYQQVGTLLAKYPQGTDSLTPPNQQGDPRTSFMMSSSRPGSAGGSGGGAAASALSGGVNNMPSPLEMQQVAKIAADADVHPQDALANAQAVPRPNLRAAALEAVARANSKKNASVARSALAKQVDLASQLDLPVQLHNLSDAARLYLDMGETDDAKKTIERGLKAADEMYKQDDNADDPNKALKAYWPSTEAYRSLLRIAGQISPAWALKLAGEISDPEIKVLVQIALAGAWLDVPGGPSTTMSSTKKGNQIMMSMDD